MPTSDDLEFADFQGRRVTEVAAALKGAKVEGTAN